MLFARSQPAALVVPVPDVKRQKIDLKGPRVKHVCRSASIVLGQPIATFGTDNSGDSNKKSDTPEVVTSEKSDSAKCIDPLKSVVEEDVSTSFVVQPKKQRAHSLPTLNSQPLASIDVKGILLNHSHELNIENRFKSGFSVITSEKISTSALCYLCGSAGIGNTIICSLCCESYHTFCIEDYRPSMKFDNTWLCLKCTPCQECKGFERTKISCPKCLKVYHKECFSRQENATILKLICKECTKCQECGTPTAYNLSSFPGNLPLCLNCVDKKKVGQHCPICQHSFEENIIGSKMLECSSCKKWVHSDCEKLTSEQYDVLKLLPVSSNFRCSRCAEDRSCSTWCKSIQAEMYRSFNQILRSLMKNKTAKVILKRVGVKGSLFRKFVLTKNLDIDNNNYNKDNIYSFEESERPSKWTVNTLLDIKNRLCDYNSVKTFNNDMQEALKLYESEQIVLIYKNIFQTVFPWFTQSHEAADAPPATPENRISLNYRHSQTFVKKSQDDSRKCDFCHASGDGSSTKESRLLYCGNNSWVHANCAYWSTTVNEQIDNHLQNVLTAVATSKTTVCTVCDRTGASIQCHLCRSDNYHFMCARKAGFCFTHVDKACFCAKHEKPEFYVKIDEDFEVNRTLFVEPSLSTLRAEPHKVMCLIGSLQVKNLGKIDPIVSDTVDTIIPTGYVCSRVFWSTKEPWKLVTYVISTSIQNPNCTTLTVDKNFTVDHSLEPQLLDKAMKELNDWLRVYEKKPEELDSEDEEEKNGTELLSPELTDTLLEDLPHDILDGISVQDIFPNFSYEDMLNLDNSNTDISISDSPSTKKQHEDNEDLGGSKVPPLSITVSYKVDSNAKKRKISKEVTNNLLLLQVDGAFDDSSSELGSPNGMMDPWEEPVTCEKCQCTYRTQASYKRHLDSCEVFCTSESDSENVPDHEINQCDEQALMPAQPIEVTFSQPPQQQPVLFQAFESFQSSQVHTSMMNVVPEAQVQPAIAIADQTPLSISVPLCMGPQIVQPPMEFQPQVLLQRPPRRDPVMVQQIQPAPSGFVPFVDAFGQTQTNQSVQYVQIAPQVQPQPQLLQIRSDGNVIGIVPSIQPTTVIVQQPQQLVLDSNGTFGWAPQQGPQPQILYGFETIVQNTVMQSQQFLPTPVPGVLTANSSYSTTTQVFQTSKLEPVLDVSSNSFVLVNSSGQLELPHQQFSQAQPAAVVTSQTPTLIYTSQPSNTQKTITAPQNCISLPTAPFVSDQNIPMNVVPPIPKPPTSHGRPMSRVLPMPTNAVKTSKKIADVTKLFPEAEKPYQIKFDDKLMFSKDLMKMIDNPKVRNRKFEVLDYEVIQPQPKIFKVEEKPFKQYEPVEKLYEPLKEIEKVKMEMFQKPINSLSHLDNSRPKECQLAKPKPVMEIVAQKPEHNTLEYTLQEFERLQKPVLECSRSKIENQLFVTLSSKEKALDMPQLDDITPNKELSSFLDSEKFLTKTVPPLLSVKPQPIPPKEADSLKPLHPKPPLKKELENDGAPSILYTIENQEVSFKCSSTSVSDCWMKVLDAVQAARAAHSMPLLNSEGKHVKSVQITGLKSSHVKYLVEQIPGASKCVKYKPLFKFTPHTQDGEICTHGYGAIRCQPHLIRTTEPYDIFSWLSSKHRGPFSSLEPQTVQSRRVNNFPMAMKFKNLKLTSKYSVGVYRSKIHGKGLFCLRDIEPGEMVIEYAGEVIRSILTDKREKYYNSKGIGCYMFRVDDNFVVDATMKGNAARFINHSCDPNCYSKVVEIVGHKHIIIFALRRILSGEELTYDYKFPFEEDKIPCTCGARRCRKFLN